MKIDYSLRWSIEIDQFLPDDDLFNNHVCDVGDEIACLKVALADQGVNSVEEMFADGDHVATLTMDDYFEEEGLPLPLAPGVLQ